MNIEEYINSGTVKRRNSPIYESALRMAYDYHKGMDKKRLVILWDKARDGDTDSWEGLAICVIIHKLLEEIINGKERKETN